MNEMNEEKKKRNENERGKLGGKGMDMRRKESPLVTPDEPPE